MYYLYDAICEEERDDAIRVSAVDLMEDIWIPRSGIAEGSEVREEGDNGTLIIEDWVAEKNGLE